MKHEERDISTLKHMPWSEIKRMRDKAAHHYGEFDVTTLWETVTEDIGPLREYCAACIEKLSGLQTVSNPQR
jgi:uncharacterized protein with HEPN domain